MMKLRLRALLALIIFSGVFCGVSQLTRDPSFEQEILAVTITCGPLIQLGAQFVPAREFELTVIP